MSIDSRGLLLVGAAEESDKPSLKSLWREAFGDTDGFIDLFFKTAFSPDRCRVVKDGNEVAAALYIFDCEALGAKTAYIYAVATRKSHRGKGLCASLMDDTHKYLSERGYSCAVLVPSEPSLFDFYEKMGYKTCSYITELESVAKEGCVGFEKIGKSEYAALRRKYLPQNGVIQENENLDFFETYAAFYKGEDFVFAGYTNKGKLYCAELLGNREKFENIVFALDCEIGFFRAPQGENLRPFAMGYPLDGNYLPELYFGLAFD